MTGGRLPLRGRRPHDRPVRTAAVVALLAALALAWWVVHRQRLKRGFSTPRERVTFETLHAANAAAPALRLG